MKKLMAFTTAFLFVGVLSLSIMAFSDDDPKKQKTETTATEQCVKQKEASAGTTDTKPCCKESTENGSAGCQKSGECKHHSEKTADVKE
jgi:hypothetical protein